MNNLHRRRMQENPFPPLNDYIRLVSQSDTLRVTCATNSGQVWVAYENNGKKMFTRFSCAEHGYMNHDNLYFSVPAKEAFFIQVSGVINASTNALDVYDASMSKSQVKFDSKFNSIVNSVGMSLIDMSNSKMSNLKLIGYPNHATNYGWYHTSCKNAKVYNCTNAKKLLVNGYDKNSEIHGLYTCTNLEEVEIYQSKIYNNNEEVISVFDGSNFPNLQKLTLSHHTYLTSLDNLPSGLTTLDCTNCTGITSLDNLPSGLTTLTCKNCIGLTSIDNLPAGLTTLDCCGIQNVDVSYLEKLQTLSCDGAKFKDKKLIAPASLTSLSGGLLQLTSADLSKCSNLSTCTILSKYWVIGGLIINPSINTLSLGTSWGNWVYPMPDLTACTNLTSINCQRCSNIPNLDQQAFIDSLPTFTDGSTHTINLKNTGVIADTAAAIQAKGWTVQV